MNSFNLEQKVALVTGAGRGIGAACVEGLASMGAKVIAVARTQSDLDRLVSAHPNRVEAWCMDVTQADFLQAVAALPKLDILVNNVGSNKPEPFVEVSSDTLSSLINLNVCVGFSLSQAAVRIMEKNQCKGSIIHITSQMGHVGSPNRSVYCMTKHAVEGLNKAMAVELAPKGIRVNSVAPTFIETDLTRPMLADPDFRQFVERMIPMGVMGQPEDVASAVVYLASDAAAMVTGQSLKVDGGWTAQ